MIRLARAFTRAAYDVAWIGLGLLALAFTSAGAVLALRAVAYVMGLQ